MSATDVVFTCTMDIEIVRVEESTIVESCLYKFRRKEPYNFYAEISVTGSAGGGWAGVHHTSFPEHVPEMPDMCPDMRRALHIFEK